MHQAKYNSFSLRKICVKLFDFILKLFSLLIHSYMFLLKLYIVHVRFSFYTKVFCVFHLAFDRELIIENKSSNLYLFNLSLPDIIIYNMIQFFVIFLQ